MLKELANRYPNWKVIYKNNTKDQVIFNPRDSSDYGFEDVRDELDEIYGMWKSFK